MKKRIKSKQFLILLSFIIPIILMLGYFIYRNVYPFGNSSLLTVDMGQEYVDFFSMYRNTFLHHFSTLFYSFASELGSSMYGTWTCYIFSPFNLILLLTPGKYLTVGIMIITLLKVGCMGAAFAYFLIKTKWQKGYMIPLLSIVYALNGFAIANLLNMIWFDAMIILPFVALGIEYLVKKQQWYMYPIALAAILLIDYYMGYMVCIFAVLYFIWAVVRTYHDPHTLWQNIKQFILSSLLAGILSLIVLLPTYLELKQSKMNYNPQTVKWHFEYNPLEMISKFITGCFNFNQMPKGTPNLFVGMLVLIGVVCYFTRKSITLREKITTFGVSIFLTLSMCFAPLDLFWHGMQFPVWYPYRFSYVVCFWLIIIAARGLNNLHALSKLQILLTIIILGFLYSYNYINVKTFDYLHNYQIIISSIFGIAFIILLTYLNQKSKPIMISMLVLTCFEMTINMAISLNPISYVNQSDFARYVTTLQSEVNQFKPQQNQFYRIGKTFMRSRNDALQCDYYGTDLFDSMLNPHVSQFMQDIGQSAGDNYTSYTNGTLFTDSLLGIKYIFQNRNVPAMFAKPNNQSNPILPPSSYRPDLLKDNAVKQSPLITVYKNPEALALGFAASDKILTTTLQDDQPIQNQNLIIKGLTGNNIKLFEQSPNFHVVISSLKSLGNNKYAKIDPNDDASVTVPYQGNNDPHYLTLGPAFNNNNVSFTFNGNNVTQYSIFNNPVVLALYSQNNANNSLIIDLNKNSIWLQNFDLYYLNMSNYYRAMKTLRANQLHLTHFSNTKITGNITIKKQQVMMTTIPFNKGWHAIVDGHHVTIKKALNTFIAIPMSKGHHTIKLYYRTPMFIFSAVISSLAWLLLISVIIIAKRKNN